MSERRGIDHLVLAVSDLDAAERAYGRLGFTLTPRARHPFGTANNLAIFDGNFLELLGVDAPEKIPPHTAERFSFAAYNAEVMGRREGISMLVLDSRDARADHRNFTAQGLRTYEPVDFSRGAVQPDGSEERVAFTIVFVTDPRLPEAPHFVCQQHNPEHFWKAAYQAHANTAQRIVGATLAAEVPAEIADHYRALTGQAAVVPRAGGLRVETARGVIDILPAAEIPGRFAGVELALPALLPAYVAMTIAVADLAAAAALLEANGVPHARTDGVLRLGPAEARGAVLEFVEGRAA